MIKSDYHLSDRDVLSFKNEKIKNIEIFNISKFFSPEGVLTDIISLDFFPINALPIGDLK